MIVRVTRKNEEDPFQKEGARVVTTCLPNCNSMSRRSMAGNSAIRCRIWPKFELINVFMVVIVTYKNEEDPTKNAGAHNIKH